jgi:excisionase family DNA binding protein
MGSELISDRDEMVVSFFEKLSRMEKELDRLAANGSSALNGEHYITDKELSEALKISRYTLWEYRSRGIIPYYEVGSKILYKASEIEAWMRKYYRAPFR